MSSIPQGTIFIALRDFSFKVGGKGKSVIIKGGQKFWSTKAATASRETVLLCREGKGSIGTGWSFTHEQLSQLFTQHSVQGG